MSDPRSELAADFAAAARLLRAGSATAAMVRLLPLPLTESELALRVPLLIDAGADTATALDPAAVAEVMAAGHDEPVDLLVDLVALVARLDHGDEQEGGL